MAKKETTLVRCIDCENAVLMRYYNNPIIAECKAKNGDRDVAEQTKLCSLFRRTNKQVEIEQKTY